MPPTIIGKECRFATHSMHNRYDLDDIHVVKEILHFDDGTQKPNVSIIKNFERPFWITKPGYRNHVQKKEWEDCDKLLQYRCTQSSLRLRVANALGKSWSKDTLKQLCSSPYVYGADTTSTSLIKSLYRQKYPNFNTPYTVAALDYETNMFSQEGEIILGTCCFQNKIHLAVCKDFVKDITLFDEKIISKYKRYLSDYIDTDTHVFTYEVCDTELDVIVSCFKHIHEWKPDWVAIWNIYFDMDKMLSAFKRFNVNPADVFSDPIVPPEYRYFKYKPGPTKKVMASGKAMPIRPSAQWHVAYSTSSFSFIDAMCCYKLVRLGKPEETKYELDHILKKHKLPPKFKIPEADIYVKGAWHKFMQTHYKVEYCIYGIWDTRSMLMLDEQTKDLSYTVPMSSEFADFDIYKSQPKRIANALYYEQINEGRVLAASGAVGYDPAMDNSNDDEEDDLLEIYALEDEDKENSVGIAENLRGWIVNLASENMMMRGLRCIAEDPKWVTNFYLGVTDMDAEAAYPSATEAGNVSKETTVKELISVKGIPNRIVKLNNIDLMSGHVNAVAYCVNMFGFPSAKTLLNAYKEKKNMM